METWEREAECSQDVSWLTNRNSPVRHSIPAYQANLRLVDRRSSRLSGDSHGGAASVMLEARVLWLSEANSCQRFGIRLTKDNPSLGARAYFRGTSEIYHLCVY
jgi:hypothetical protein